MSEYTDTKARKLIKSGKVAKVNDNMWQVAGSKPNTMYVVMLEPLHCDCMGFVFRQNCSHIRAVEMAKGIPIKPTCAAKRLHPLFFLSHM